jgi:hypothetical protein
MFPESVSGWFTKSLVDLVLLDSTEGSGFLRDSTKSGFIALSSGPRVAEARNKIIDTFAENYPGCDWLLMLDSDMTFRPDLLEQLMAVADPVEAPIVGGLCFAGGRSGDPYPTIYRLVQGDGYATVDRVDDYPRDALVKVGATGAACVLMHRQALATMQAKFGKTETGATNPYPWFVEGAIGPKGEPWGEDIAFCLRAHALGIPVHVHTGVKLGHMKTQCVDEVFFDNHRRASELTAQGAFDGPAPHVPNRAERRAAARRKVQVS